MLIIAFLPSAVQDPIQTAFLPGRADMHGELQRWWVLERALFLPEGSNSRTLQAMLQHKVTSAKVFVGCKAGRSLFSALHLSGELRGRLVQPSPKTGDFSSTCSCYQLRGSICSVIPPAPALLLLHTASLFAPDPQLAVQLLCPCLSVPGSKPTLSVWQW